MLVLLKAFTLQGHCYQTEAPQLSFLISLLQHKKESLQETFVITVF